MDKFFAVVMMDCEFTRVWMSEAEALKILETYPSAVVIRTDVNMMAVTSLDTTGITWATVPNVSAEETIKHAIELASEDWQEHPDPLHVL